VHGSGIVVSSTSPQCAFQPVARDCIAGAVESGIVQTLSD
jgi:hypothetical protein